MPQNYHFPPKNSSKSKNIYFTIRYKREEQQIITREAETKLCCSFCLINFWFIDLATYQIIIKAFDSRLHGNIFSGHHLYLNSFFLDAGEDLR